MSRSREHLQSLDLKSIRRTNYKRGSQFRSRPEIDLFKSPEGNVGKEAKESIDAQILRDQILGIGIRSRKSRKYNR